MSAGLAWMQAFPLAEADRAVEALLQAWTEMARVHRTHFNPRIEEPKLTRVLRAYVRKEVSTRMGLMGHWGTEGVENDVDFETGQVLQEARTDICYYWNDTSTKVALVFEFKKLSATSESRKHYLHGGVAKFVTGIYSEREPVALMVGIVMAPRDEVLSGLRRAIAHPPTAGALRTCEDEEGRFVLPCKLFPSHALFDTEHLRDEAKAPSHGTIRLAHVLVEFPWFDHSAKARRRKRREPELESET